MTELRKVWSELRNGPATSRDLSDASGIPVKRVSQYRLGRYGHAKRIGTQNNGACRPSAIWGME